MVRFFDHALRVLSCGHCGAPLQVPLTGGTVTCGYCQSTSELRARDERADLAEAATPSSLSEAERMARLRQQDHRPPELPATLHAFVQAGTLIPGSEAAAEAEWLNTYRRVRAGAPFAESERLFHLTRLVGPCLEASRQRAVLETSIETLTDKGHRHSLRCMLAKLAAIAGDAQAARAWLAPCSPRSSDLGMDSAYRLATCYIAAAERHGQAILQALGYRAEDVPIADGMDSEAMLLRAAGLELNGDAKGAAHQLFHFMEADHGRIVELDHHAAAVGALPLAPTALPQARAWIMSQLETHLRGDLSRLKRSYRNRSIFVAASAACLVPFVGVAAWSVWDTAHSLQSEDTPLGFHLLAISLLAGLFCFMAACLGLLARAISRARLGLSEDGSIVFATVVDTSLIHPSSGGVVSVADVVFSAGGSQFRKSVSFPDEREARQIGSCVVGLWHPKYGSRFQPPEKSPD